MPAPGVLTHCPYCALQCGMSLREAGGGLQPGSRDFPTNRGGLCQKGWTSAELLTSPDRLTTPLVRAHRGAPLERSTPGACRLGRGAGAGDGGDPARPVRVRAGGGRGLRGWRPDQRKGVCAGEIRPGRTGHAEHRLQRPVLHVVGGGGRDTRFRHRPRAAVPAPRPRGRRCHPAGGQQRRRDHAALHAVAVRSAGGRRRADRGRSAADPDRPAGHAAPAGHARDGPGARERPAAHRDRRGPRRRVLRGRADVGIRRGAPGRRRVLAGAGGAHYRRDGRRAAVRGPPPRRG